MVFFELSAYLYGGLSVPPSKIHDPGKISPSLDPHPEISARSAEKAPVKWKCGGFFAIRELRRGWGVQRRVKSSQKVAKIGVMFLPLFGKNGVNKGTLRGVTVGDRVPHLCPRSHSHALLRHYYGQMELG